MSRRNDYRSIGYRQGEDPRTMGTRTYERRRYNIPRNRQQHRTLFRENRIRNEIWENIYREAKERRKNLEREREQKERDNIRTCYLRNFEKRFNRIAQRYIYAAMRELDNILLGYLERQAEEEGAEEEGGGGDGGLSIKKSTE